MKQTKWFRFFLGKKIEGQNVKTGLTMFLFLFAAIGLQAFASMPATLNDVSVLEVQETTISGTVVDENNVPLGGATVVATGTSAGTTTDFDGKYSMSVPDGASSITVSYLGYEPLTVAINGRSVIDVQLTESTNALDEVVVTALGIEKSKKSLAYSVTEVDGDQLTLSRDPNAMNALQGKVAGVNISKPVSGPGGSTRVIIRGNNSLNGNNQPLYVIDGVPIDNTNFGSAGQWGGADSGDGISGINPDDIENISVLKGANAAALYGSRASNGVILITTKSGKSQSGVTVELNSNFLMEKVNNLTDWQTEYGIGSDGQKPTTLLEAGDYGAASWGGRLDGSSVIQFDGVSRPYSYAGSAIDKFYRTGTSFTNTLSVSGGGEFANYRFSASDLDNESIMPNSGLDRNTFSANINGSLGKFSASISGTYTTQEIQNAPGLSDFVWNANGTVLVFPTSLDVNNLKGDPNKLGADPESGGEYLGSNSVWWANPYWVAYQVERNDTKTRLNGNIRLRYDFTDWLYVQGRAGTDTYNTTGKFLTPTGHGFRPNGSLNLNRRRYEESNYDFILGGNKQFDMGLGIDAFIGGNQLIRVNDGENLGGSNFAIPFFHSYANLADNSASVFYDERKTNSLYYSAEVSYKSIYLTTTGRKDWFSTLDGRSIFYPSFGLSAVLSDMFDIGNTVDFLKLRGSWGQVGGDTNAYQTTFNYGLGSPHNGNAQGQINNGAIPNRELIPYTVTEAEVGVDARFLGGRLGIDFAYYDRKTEDDILNANVTISSGYGSTTVNVGEVSNKGIEFLITGTPIKTEDFEWNTSINLSHNESEVVSLLDPEVDDEFVQLQGSRTLTAYIRHIEGMPYGQIVGYKYARDANGEIILDDNGLPTRNDELVPFGSGVAPTTGGWSNSFRYKNFNMSFLIDFKYGGYIHGGTNSVAYSRGLHKATLVGRDTGIGSVAAADVQDYYGRIASQITEDFIYKSDFIKFRELSFGYSFPNQILEKTPFSALSLSLVGRNLFIIHKAADNIDPESTYNNGNSQGLEYGSLPTTRSLGLNLNVKF